MAAKKKAARGSTKRRRLRAPNLLTTLRQLSPEELERAIVAFPFSDGIQRVKAAEWKQRLEEQELALRRIHHGQDIVSGGEPATEVERIIVDNLEKLRQNLAELEQPAQVHQEAKAHHELATMFMQQVERAKNI